VLILFNQKDYRLKS